MDCRDIGPLDANIMIVGEAPGKTEEQQGKPFVGSSGKLLKQMLSHSGINYSKCYVTNVAPVRPRDNKFKEFYDGRSPTKQLQIWQKQLRDKIEKIQPNVVIALGAEPLYAILNKRGISSWRGCISTYKGIKIIPTFHPSYVIRQYQTHPIVEMDLAKALQESKFKEHREDRVDIKLSPSLREALEFLNVCKNNVERVSWDLETVGKHIRCVGLAIRRSGTIEAMTIPFMRFKSSSMAQMSKNNIIQVGGMSGAGASYWTESEEYQVLNALAELMESPYVQKVGHNSISFDQTILADEFNMSVNNHYMDTMHAFHLLYAELPKSLDFCNSILCNYHNYWSDKSTAVDESEWEYCAYDAASTLDISFKIEREIDERGMRTVYKRVNDLALALERVQRRGVKIDNEARLELIEKQKQKLADIKQKIKDTVGEAFNPNSPKQVKELLYDKLKFPVVKKNKKPTTDEAAIMKLARKYPKEEILKDIITFRKVSKLISTFLDIKIDDDGRMRTSYNASGTKGGRISSSKNLWGEGMNLQNIPVGKSRGVENIRNIFVASSSKKYFVRADLHQAETLVVAEILKRHGDPTLYNLHKDPNFDVHKWMASHIFRKPVESVTKYQRNIGKLANHSGNYGAGPGVLVNKAVKEEIYELDYQMAKKILAAREKAIPGLKKWWRDVEMQLRKTRTLTTCLGRQRVFFGRMDNSTFRDAYSYEPQSTIGEVTNMILTDMELNHSNKFEVLLQVHDEIDGECLKTDIDNVAATIEEVSKVPLYINKEPLIIPVDIEIGSNWRDVNKYKETLNR